MISTDIDYPDGLPVPTRDGYEFRPVQTFLRTQMASGRAKQRRAFSDVPTMVNVNWIFNGDTQAAAFEAWFRDSIFDGDAWFNCPLKTPIGMQQYICRFVNMYTGPNLVGLCAWSVRAELEIYERPLISPDWSILPDYVIHSDIFDIAVNRLWPKP